MGAPDRRTVSAFLAPLLLLSLLAPLALPAGQIECEAKLVSELLKREEGDAAVDWIFGVAITTDAACADVEFDLVVQEKSDSGESTEKRTSTRMRVGSGEGRARKIRHRVARGTRVLRWEFAVTGCRACPPESTS